ncbi:MAG TPA: tRNA lysidine(34) synthetase TilS [Acidimicrobiia bacterium]
MAATRRLTELVDSARARTRLPPGPVTVALSGGADSAALAHLAIESGAEVSVIHIDHGFAASEMLAAAAEQIAGRLGLALETVSVDVQPGGSVEARAREARYAVLERVDGAVLTAHTRDDAVETMLINLIRGTGIDGLGGIPYHRPPNVYRPILSVTRSETREIAALAGLDFRDDPMNADLDLTRNHIRHVVLPRMRELNPRLDEAMARTAAGLRMYAEFLDQLTVGVPPDALAISVLATLPRVVADRLVRRWLERQGVEVSADLVDRVWSVVSAESPRQELEGGRSVVRDRAVVRVE